MERHNDLRDRVTELDGKAFTSTHMRSGCAVQSTKAHPSGSTHPPLKKSEAT